MKEETIQKKIEKKAKENLGRKLPLAESLSTENKIRSVIQSLVEIVEDLQNRVSILEK